MTKFDKRLMKIVIKMAEDSFSAENKLEEEKVKKFVSALKSLPRSQAITALSFYLKMVKAGLEKTTMQIESAISLSSAQLDQIVNSIKAKQPVYTVNVQVRDSLLGGLRVKIGDVVFDGSVAQRILQLQGVIYG